jgi:putative membrane protein
MAEDFKQHGIAVSAWKGAVAGAAGGVAGVLAMTALERMFDQLRGDGSPEAVRRLSQRGGRHDIARLKARARRFRLPQEDATVRAAQRISRAVRGRKIKVRNRHLAGLLVHYGFGACAGLLYGLAVERYPKASSMAGLPFGAAVWLLGEEIGLPLMNLTDAPNKYPALDHVNALAAHLVFGSATEAVRGLARNGSRRELAPE